MSFFLLALQVLLNGGGGEASARNGCRLDRVRKKIETVEMNGSAYRQFPCGNQEKERGKKQAAMICLSTTLSNMTYSNRRHEVQHDPMKNVT